MFPGDMVRMKQQEDAWPEFESDHGLGLVISFGPMSRGPRAYVIWSGPDPLCKVTFELIADLKRLT